MTVKDFLTNFLPPITTNLNTKKIVFIATIEENHILIDY